MIKGIHLLRDAFIIIYHQWRSQARASTTNVGVSQNVFGIFNWKIHYKFWIIWDKNKNLSNLDNFEYG